MIRWAAAALLVGCACGQAGGFRIDGSVIEDRDAGIADSGVVRTSTIPDPSMSFFVTSSGNSPLGGDYGGLEGADLKCESHAMAVGLERKTWRAYLGQSDAYPPNAIVHARDRIGPGPWFNFYGEMIAAGVTELHAVGPQSARIFTEQGGEVPIAEHDIMTGTD